MEHKIPSAFLTITMVATLFLTGCQPPLPSSLSDDQVVQVVEDILTAFDSGDYAVATKDMSAKMVKAFPEGQFLNMADWLKISSGNFLSCAGAVPELSNNAGYAVYRLPCSFELETVTVSVAFFIASSQVEGLYFDSPNLRKANQATPTPAGGG
ncbi:MAG: hypothetical protein ABSG01_11385 [Anaerolineales bacterium]|jgi:hypothetical protein